MKWLDKWNQEGFPVILARDPKTGKGSFSATLIVMSAGLVACAVFKVRPEIDGTLAIAFFTVCTGLYYGRNKDNSVKSEAEQEIKPE
jgi:hypothetical protein